MAEPEKTSVLGMLPAAAGVVGGMIGQIGARRRQMEDQQKLQDMQVRGQKEMLEAQRQKEMQMWQDTNYSAQVDQMKQAGINPALLYGKGGGGGTTVGGGGMSVSGGQASTSAQTTQASTGMGMMMGQLAMQAAQMELIKAQTNKTNVEANKIGGIDTELATTENKFKQIMVSLEGQSLEYKLDKLAQEVNIAEGQASSALAKGNVDEVTVKAQIDKVRQEAVNAALQGIALEKGVQLDNAKINEITQGIQQKWKELSINETKSRYEHEDRVKAIEEYTENALKVAGIMAVGNVVRDVVGIATRKVPKGKTTETYNDGTGASTWKHETYK